MMQSVALTDSVQHDDGFVVVEAPIDEPGSDHTSYDDEASYDYCDDVFSIASFAQSFTVTSHALQTFQEDFFDYPHPDFLNKSGDGGLPGELQELRISPAEAAADADGTEPEASEISYFVDESIGSSKEGTSIHAEEMPETAADESPGHGEESSSFADCALAASGSEKESLSYINKDTAATDSSGEKSKSSSSLSSSSDEEEDSGTSTDDDKVEAVASAVATALGKKASRMSGKKRRKQLKLAKKAAAAAAAAAALGQITMTVQTPARGKSNRQTTNRSSGTKVANISVSCATTAVAEYREELRLAKQIR